MIFVRSDWLQSRNSEQGYSLFWKGIQNGCSFRDSFERWNFSGKWISCINKYQERDKVSVYWSVEKNFRTVFATESLKMIPETLSIETWTKFNKITSSIYKRFLFYFYRKDLVNTKTPFHSARYIYPQLFTYPSGDSCIIFLPNQNKFFRFNLSHSFYYNFILW